MRIRVHSVRERLRKPQISTKNRFSLFHVDPGILPLLMMSKGYITAEIDKLAQYPEYAEVIRMDPPEAAAAPPKKRTRQETKACHALPSLEQLRYLEELAEKKIEGKAPKAYDELRGTGQVSADVFNLSDMRQVMRLQEYL